MSSYSERVINKANFILIKFGDNSSKHKNYHKYKKWLTENKCQHLPLFSYGKKENLGVVNSSEKFYLELRKGKKHNYPNKILVFKEFLIKHTGGREVSIDELASFISIHTLHYHKTLKHEQLKHDQLKQNQLKIESVKETPSKLVEKKELKEEKGEIKGCQAKDDEDWESLF